MTDDVVEKVAKAISRPEIWHADSTKKFPDLWVRDERLKAMEKARAAIAAYEEAMKTK